MYHLVKRLSGAIAALLLVLASGGALHALPISGFIADQTTSHAGADIVVGLVPSFVYAPGPGPTGLYSFTATPIGGDPVVTVTVVGDDLYINPINGTSGRADIRVVATDASGSLGIEFRVEVTNDAPTLSSIGNQSLAEGSALSFSAVASDADGTGEILTFSLDPGAPSGASIDPSTGAFSWTPSEAQGPDSYTVTIRVTDAVGESDAATFDVDVDEVNQAPVLGPIGDQTIDEESLLTFVAAAADADVPANALTYSLDGGAPPGALIDPISGVFSWTPAEADSPGSFTITVRASDDGTPSLDATETITITVVEVNDAPSLIPGGDVPDQFMDEDDPTLNVEVRSQFDDADLVDTPPDTLTVIVLPGYDAGLVSVVPNASGVEITPLADQHGTTTVTVGVEDGAGSSATDTFLLTVNPVNDDPSVVNPIADINTLEDDPTTFTIDLSTVFADPDVATDGDSLSFSMTNSNSGLFDVNSLSGSVLSLHLRPDQYGTAVITVRATDSLG
ncbi:MAG TPA: putative Ig domain-containing protein, partial [Pseudomonadales bacterium]